MKIGSGIGLQPKKKTLLQPKSSARACAKLWFSQRHHRRWRLPPTQMTTTLAPLRTFLWKLAHQMILTNVERARRMMTNTRTCEMCGIADETLFHRFRDCNCSLAIWSCFHIRRHQQFFNCADWNNWLCSNLNKRDFGEEEDHWHILFGVVLDQIWQNRNSFIFSQKRINTETSVIKIRNSVNAISTYLNRTKYLKAQLPSNPDLGSSSGATNANVFWKLNCDSAVNNNGNNCGCGGVLRDPAGEFKLAYMNKIEPCSVLEAELKAIFHGISLAREQGIVNLIIEADSSDAIDLLRLRNYHGHHLQTLICDILDLGVGFEEFEWKKIDRNRNQLADVMARQSLYLSNDNSSVFNVIPFFLIQAFNSERIGLAGSSL